MLCDICKQNEATVHLTQIVGDKMQKVDLCESCSKEKVPSDPAYSLADQLLGLGATKEPEETGADLKCPNCGFTQADFKKTGRFGCPACYATFADALQGLLKSMHKGIRHVGKTPQSQQRTRDYANKVKSLQSRLDKAIAEENFEQAALLRDEIKEARSCMNRVAST